MAKPSSEEIEVFRSRLNSPEFAGHIIQWVSIFESRLDVVLAAYFVNPDLADDRDPTSGMFDQVLSRLSFAVKIDVLRNLKFQKKLKSQARVVESLDRLRKLRNVLAHNYHIHDGTINKLRSDGWTFRFVINYPGSVGREKNALENRFSHLWNSCIQSHYENMQAEPTFVKVLSK